MKQKLPPPRSPGIGDAVTCLSKNTHNKVWKQGVTELVEYPSKQIRSYGWSKARNQPCTRTAFKTDYHHSQTGTRIVDLEQYATYVACRLLQNWSIMANRVPNSLGIHNTFLEAQYVTISDTMAIGTDLLWSNTFWGMLIMWWKIINCCCWCLNHANTCKNKNNFMQYLYVKPILFNLITRVDQ